MRKKIHLNGKAAVDLRESHCLYLMERIKKELDVLNSSAVDRSRVFNQMFWIKGQERSAVETLRQGFTIFCVRIFNLFFISSGFYAVLSERLKRDLSTNAIILKGNSDSDNGVRFPFGDWTALTIVAMMHAGVAGKRVIDLGAGNGVLSIAALKLGASSVDLVDVGSDILSEAYVQLEANKIRRRQYRLHKADVKHFERLAETIPPAMEETAIVSNIGQSHYLQYWNDYTANNEDSIRFVDALPKVAVVICGGYLEDSGIGGKMALTRKDQMLVRNRGYSTGPGEIVAVECKTGAGLRLKTAWFGAASPSKCSELNARPRSRKCVPVQDGH